MRRDDGLRLATVADAVRAQRGQRVPENWQEPRHAALLKAPEVLLDDIVGELFNDGMGGQPLPWEKTAGIFRLRPGEMTLWAGSNGSAKSTLLSEILLHLATAGQRVVVISLEMPAYKVAARMAIQAFASRTPARSRLEKWAQSLGETLCFLDFTGDIEPAEAVRLVRYCAHELQTQHVLLDNLTKSVSADNEHTEQQRRFIAELHRSAIETGMHVHLVAHTRKPSGDEDKPPGRYEVAGSRTLVDQPDNVVMIWRNRPKEEKVRDGALDQGDKPDLVINVCKQRYGDFEGPIGLWMRRDSYRFVGDYADAAVPYFRD